MKSRNNKRKVRQQTLSRAKLTKDAIRDIAHIIQRDKKPGAPKQAEVADIRLEPLVVGHGLILGKNIVVGGEEQVV